MGAHARKIKFNLASVVLCQIVTIAIGFLLPRLYIENFGSSVNGVLSTIKQIFTYLCLLESGVGLASVQALLRPVAQGSRGEINGILAATRNYYIKIGYIYAAAVSAIALIYGFAVNTGLPSYVVIALVFLNGIPSLVTFFIEGKYGILLETDGLQYVITNSQIFLQVFSGLLKAAVLLLTNNLILMQSAYCLVSTVQLLYITLYAKRHYKWLDFGVKPNFAAISQKNSVLIHQISGMVFNNTDILLLSFLSDFKAVSVYYIYNLFFSQTEIFISSLVKGFNFALGQLFSTDTEEFLKKYRIYESLYVTANFIVYTAMCVFLLPIIRIYTGGIKDADYIQPALIFLFVIAKLISAAKLPANQVIEYSGRFSETKWHAITEMAINLSLTVIGIIRWGICGALAGTVAAIIFRNSVTVLFVNRRIFRRSAADSFLLTLVNGAVFAAVFAVFGASHFGSLGFWELCRQGLINMPWIATLYIAANAALRPDVYKQLLKAAKGRLAKK